MHLGFIRFLTVTDLQPAPSPQSRVLPLVRLGKTPATERHPGRDSFTSHGVFSPGARGQPLRSRARCDWSPCDGPRLQSWRGTAPKHCYLGLWEARTSEKETRNMVLLPQDWGWDRPAPHSIRHKCSVAPAFPAKAVNPSLVLRSSDRNPARQHRLAEGALACG